VPMPILGQLHAMPTERIGNLALGHRQDRGDGSLRPDAACLDG
jgi:hypothetical protein